MTNLSRSLKKVMPNIERSYSDRHQAEDGVQGWNPWLGASPQPPFKANVLSKLATAIT
ncbi:hypothetical protein [Leptothermofonsia sp. ETS-13]|uniref:hypothetical protein n=1 Tax=Leptothermofonsia sp. ETS-13 TaxID=3035696 RepID=UPI003BA33190